MTNEVLEERPERSLKTWTMKMISLALMARERRGNEEEEYERDRRGNSRETMTPRRLNFPQTQVVNLSLKSLYARFRETFPLFYLSILSESDEQRN